MITVGIDEAGVGCMAGPMVIVAAAFDDDKTLSDRFLDSKKLNDDQREGLIDEIYDTAEWVVIKRISASYINRSLHVWEAWTVAMRELLEFCTERGSDLIIVDGNRVICGFSNVRYEVKADDRFRQVSAASIVAKYIQSMSMLDMHDKYPKFRFDQHKGYATSYHKRILRENGPTEYHRIDYAPVKEVLVGLSAKRRAELQQLDLSASITTKVIGGS